MFQANFELKTLKVLRQIFKVDCFDVSHAVFGVFTILRGRLLHSRPTIQSRLMTSLRVRLKIRPKMILHNLHVDVLECALGSDERAQ